MGGWRIAIWAALVVAALSFLYLVRAILLPFIVAFIIAILLDPTIRRLRKRGMSRGAAISVVVGAFFVISTGLILWLAPLIGQQVGTFRVAVERLTTSISAPDPDQNFFVRWNPVVAVESPRREDPIDRALRDIATPLGAVGVPSSKKAIYDRYISPNSKQISATLQNFFNGFFGILGTFASQLMMLMLVPILVVFMLLDLDSTKRKVAAWIPPSIRASTLEILNDVGAIFVGYLRGVTLSVLIYMTVSATLLTLMGVPYSVLLGVLFGALYMIPFLGEFIGMGILLVVCGFSGQSAIVGVSTGSPWLYGAITVLMHVVFNRVYDTFIYARIVGKAVGLSPLAGMFVAFSGGALFGIPGMLLAFPVAGSVKVVLDRLIRITSTPVDGIALPAIPIRHRP